MIKEIHMKNCTPYRDEVLKDCKKTNFIYGPNGSGKSTISNFLSDPTAPMYADCGIQYDSTGPSEILVYNKQFKDSNFRGDQEIKGVFTLGAASIADIDNLNRLKSGLEGRQQAYTAAEAACELAKAKGPAARRDFRDTIWNVILQGDGKEFSEAFTGLRGSKDRFAAEVLEKYEKYRKQKQKPEICDLEDLRTRRDSLFQKTPESCQPFELPDASVPAAIRDVEAAPILRQIIVGNQDLPIGRLIQRLNNSDWVNHGRRHLDDSNICPFCQQPTITAEFRKQLEEFFGGEYEAAMNHLHKLFMHYNSLMLLMANLGRVTTETTKCVIGHLDRDTFSQKHQYLKSILLTNLKSIEDKISEPSRVVELEDTIPLIRDILDMLAAANDAIAAHNAMVKDIKNQRNRLKEDIWNYCLHQNEAVIHSHLEDMTQIKKEVEDCLGEKSRTAENLKLRNDQIAEAEKKMTSVQPAVDAINASLKAYGFHNFKIVPSDNDSNMYQIQRPDGTPAATTLSEGEETFITFLYYLQLINGSVTTSGVTGRKILVIDDPICSLDSTVLYVVSSLIHDLIQKTLKDPVQIEQIFLLTHNVYFHKEASDPHSLVKRRKSDPEFYHYWIIQKSENVSSIADYDKDNPIKSTYQMLWDELRDYQNLSMVTMQNTMRRILEYYFKILGTNPKNEIPKKFPTVEEQIVCRSLFQWLNDGSHSIPDDFNFSLNPDAPARYMDIFRRVFYEAGHEAHYNMMMNKTL